MLRLPAEEHSTDYGLAHFLGTVTVERNAKALDAALEVWIKRVRSELAAARAKAPRDWRLNQAAYAISPEQARYDFYLFHEYQKATTDIVRELEKDNRQHINPTAFPTICRDLSAPAVHARPYRLRGIPR